MCPIIFLTFPEHPEFELTYDMMFGLRFVLSRALNELPKDVLEAADLVEEISLKFPAEGSATTPAHKVRVPLHHGIWLCSQIHLNFSPISLIVLSSFSHSVRCAILNSKITHLNSFDMFENASMSIQQNT